MQSEKKSSQSLELEYSLDTYESIEDLILRFWWKIHETGDVTLLLKDKTEITDKVIAYCSDMWDTIRNQHMDKFGITSSYKEYLNQIYKVATLKADLALSQNRMLKTFLKLAELELESLTSGKVPNEYKHKAMIQNAIGRHIDPNKETVVEYYSEIQLLEERSKQDGKN
jgi:hypothetical protein